MAFTDLIPGVAQVKTAFTIAVSVALLIGAVYIYSEWHDYQDMKKNYATLEQNNKVLQENNDVIKSNLNTCQSANSTDSQTITGLLNERADAQLAVTNLAKQQQSNVATIGALKKKLGDMEKNAANDGPLAPDLRETIRGIEGEK